MFIYWSTEKLLKLEVKNWQVLSKTRDIVNIEHSLGFGEAKHWTIREERFQCLAKPNIRKRRI